MQVLDHEPVVGLDQRVGYLMQEMAAHVGDAIMVLAQLRGGPAAVDRSFLRAGELLGEVTLLIHPRRERFGRIADTSNFVAVGGGSDHKRRQAPVNADLAAIIGGLASWVLVAGMQVGGFDGQ